MVDLAKDASAWDRTRDLSVNSRALYQLSHGGNFMCDSDSMAQRQRVGFQIQRLGVRIPLGSFFKNGALGRIRTCAHIVDYDLNVAP